MLAIIIIRQKIDEINPEVEVLLGQSPISQKLYWGLLKSTGEKYIITSVPIAKHILGMAVGPAPDGYHYEMVTFSIPVTV